MSASTIFQASEAPNVAPNVADEPTARKQARFFHANGEKEEAAPSVDGPSPTSSHAPRRLPPNHPNGRNLVSHQSVGSQPARFHDLGIHDTANGSHTDDAVSDLGGSREEMKRFQFPDDIHEQSRATPGRGRTPTRDLQPSPLMMSPPHSSSFVAVRRPRLFSNSSGPSADTHLSVPFSPEKADEPSKEGNARVERKITDLEISNSSLLAINRTLERQMRKQNAELRRIRRLSFPGGLAMFPAQSFRSSLSEGEGSGSEDDVDRDNNGSDHESSNGAESESRLGVGDTKEVYIDLARHQELLDGSRSMNHSIKRCLLRTDDLIKDGRKALEYKVRANDVSLGGRVLPPEELSDVVESSRGLLRATSMASNLQGDRDAAGDEAEGGYGEQEGHYDLEE